MRKAIIVILCVMIAAVGYSQTQTADSALVKLKSQKDSAMRAMLQADSVKIEKEFAQKMKEAAFKSKAIYPAVNGGDNSGVIPVKDPTEIPDATIDYKLLFELVANNPDSSAGEINEALAEVSRVINLHVASGIPVKKIFPVIVVHAGALNAFTNNDFYKKKYKTANPNIRLIGDLEKLGAKFIACGQAMAFFDINKEALLPLVKVSLTAQTVLSSYQLKGYIKMKYW